MKKILVGLALTALVTPTLFAQPMQLGKWFAAPNELSFKTNTSIPNPVVYGMSNVPSGNTPTGGYNSYYENGNLLFYVVAGPGGGKIYNNSHTQIGMNLFGTGNIGDEIAIFPHVQNYQDPCSKVFWIIFHVKSGNSGALFGKMIDLNNTSAGQTPQLIANTTNMSDCPIAVAKMRSNGARTIYFQSSPSSSIQACENFVNTFVPTLPPTGFQSVGKEMELSNNGDLLAMVDPAGEIRLIDVGITVGQTFPTITGTSNVKGLEFDEAGTRLFFSGDYGGNSGVFVCDLSTLTPVLITGTSTYATGLLEKSYSGPGVASQIICGNATTVAGIDQVSNTLNSWTAAFSGLFMPDQVDGEDADEPLFSLIFPARSRCGAENVTTGIRVHPYTLAYFPSYFDPINIEYIGNYAGLTTPYTLATVPVSTASFPYSLNATSSFKMTLTSAINPSCFKSIVYSLYVHNCYPTVAFDLSIDHPAQGSARVLANFPDRLKEKAFADFKDAWYISEINPDNGMPDYTVANPSCWEVPVAAQNRFAGFNGADKDYKDIVRILDCHDPVESRFRIGSTYSLTRVIWADDLDMEYSTAIITIPPPPVAGPGGDDAKRQLTGMDEVQATGNVSVYPNPASGAISIKMETPAPGRVEIYDMTGKKVLVKEIGSDGTLDVIDISALPKGIYSVNVTGSGNTTVKKLAIE